MKIEVTSLPDGSLIVGCVIPHKEQMEGIKGCLDFLFDVEPVILNQAGISKSQKKKLAEAIYRNISQEAFKKLTQELSRLNITVARELHDIMYDLCEENDLVKEIRHKLNEAVIVVDEAAEATEQAKKNAATEENAKKLLESLGYNITKK